MFTLRKANSESGFMSVESIANALFYLIMIAVVTMVASKVMHSGKIATTASALSLLRSNIQYVGVNAGGYAAVNTLVLPQLIPGLVKDLATPTAGQAILPTGQTVAVGVALEGEPDESGTALVDPNHLNYFHMVITTPALADCRKIAYYGLGAGYGVSSDLAGTISIITTAAHVEAECDGANDLVLTSR